MTHWIITEYEAACERIARRSPAELPVISRPLTQRDLAARPTGTSAPSAPDGAA